jgi:hypothetical protein
MSCSNVNTTAAAAAAINLDASAKEELIRKFYEVYEMVDKYVAEVNTTLPETIENARRLFSTLDQLLCYQLANSQSMAFLDELPSLDSNPPRPNASAKPACSPRPVTRSTSIHELASNKENDCLASSTTATVGNSRTNFYYQHLINTWARLHEDKPIMASIELDQQQRMQTE